MHYPTYRQSIILLLIWLAATTVSVVALMLSFFDIHDGIGLSIAYALSMLLTIAAGFALRRNWALPMHMFPVPVIFISITAVIAAQIVIEPVQNLLPISDTLIKMSQGMRTQPYPYFFMVVIAAPVLEEILFRGIILDGFLKNYKPIHAICVSAFLFGLIHGNLAQGFGAFILGIFFGWVYWKTKSIIPCILLHAVNNGVAFFTVLFTNETNLEKSVRELINNDLFYLTLYVISIGVASGLIWILYKKYFYELPVAENPPEEIFQNPQV